MSKTPTAIIIGGSLGGLCAANLLHLAGWNVKVFERSAEELEGRGAGIVTHPSLIAILKAAGVRIDETLGIKVDERVILGRSGKREASRDFPQILTSWSRLYQLLREALPDTQYFNGWNLTHCRNVAGGVEATFENGETVAGDLLIAADGIRSTVRQMLLPTLAPQYAGYIAWRGLVDEKVLSDAVLRDLFPYFSFGLPPREQMIAYPVAGQGNATAAGRRRYNFVWYRPADEASALRDMLTDETGRVWEDGIPPPLIRRDILDAARKAAEETLAPQFLEVVNKAESLFFQPIYDLESTALAFGRIALLGDCAFVARPHCGMGVTKAAEDAQALVSALANASTIEAALEKYEAERLLAGRQIVAHARSLGAYMQAQLRSEQERKMAERYRTPESIMAETAAPISVTSG